MKTAHANALFAAVVLCTVANLRAEPPPKPPSPAERLEKMKADLNLSDAQVQKLKPLLEANMEKMNGVRSDSSLNEEQRREKSHEVRKAGGEAIMAVLNPEQKAKFEEEMKKRRKDGPPGGGGPEAQRKGPPPGGGQAPGGGNSAGKPGPKS